MSDLPIALVIYVPIQRGCGYWIAQLCKDGRFMTDQGFAGNNRNEAKQFDTNHQAFAAVNGQGIDFSDIKEIR